MFKLLYVVIFLFILFEIEAKISDKRLCANENCTKPISLAKTIIRYHTGDNGVLSFEANADVIVYSKSAGSNMDLWGVEIKGVRGYVPKAYLRETRVLTKDPNFMLSTQENNQQVPSNETEPSTVIKPDQTSSFTVFEGTTFYTDPDDAISPTPQSDILPTKTVDNVGVEKDETNDNNVESDINNKETAPLEVKNNNVINSKDLDDKMSESQPNVIETETKESLTGQMVQKLINLVGGDKKEEVDEDDEQDDEDFEEDSEEVGDDEDEEEEDDDSEEEGYVTDELDDKSDENNEEANKIPIEQEEPILKDENLRAEDVGEESVKLRQLLSENEQSEKTATESKPNVVSEDGTKLENNDSNSKEDTSSLVSSDNPVNEEHIPETVTDIPFTEPPGFDLPVPRYDEDYVTPNPLENGGDDAQKTPEEVPVGSEESLGEPTYESTENVKEGPAESEIKSDEIPEPVPRLETEGVENPALEDAEKLTGEDTKNDDKNVNVEGQEEKLPQDDIKPVESQIETETALKNDPPQIEETEDTKPDDANVKIEAQEEKLPENLEDTKPVEPHIASEPNPIENDAPTSEQVKDTKTQIEDTQTVDENKNVEETKEATIEDDREITLTDIAAENSETMSGILSGITNFFGGSSENKKEEESVQNNDTKEDQNVNVQEEVDENIEANPAVPENVDQIVTHEHDLLSMLDDGKQDTSSINEDHITQSPELITEIPIIENADTGYLPQDPLQEENPQEYAPADVLQDENYVEENVQKEDYLKDAQQTENVMDGLQEEDRVLDVQQNEEHVPGAQQTENDDLDMYQKEQAVIEAVPDVKENLEDIGNHIFDVHDQIHTKNSVEYGSCPAGESDCPTDISVVQKQLEMEEIVQAPLYGDFINLLTLLGVTGLSVALFLLGFIKIDKNRQESGLIAKINTLEKALLVASKENALLIDRVTEIQNETAVENDRISSEEYDNLNKTYQDVLIAKSSLEEQVQTLEKELENSTEVGLELNRMLSDIISSQNGSEILIANVEQLQRQLIEQQGTINTINDTLNLKDTENHELQLELEIKNKKVTHLQAELDKMAMNLFKVEEDKEQMQAKLEGEIIDLKDQVEKNKNSFNSTRTTMLDEINNLKAKCGDIQRNLDVKTNEYNILKDNFNQIKTIKNNSEALESLLNASSMKAELQQLQRDNQTLNDVLRQEQQTKFTLEKQIEIALQEAQSYRAKYDEADKEKLEARTKLEVLSNYFKEKEAQLQKELSKHESMWMEQQGEATSTVERIKYMQEELQNCKSQNELLKQEIVAQEVQLKSQISVLEKKAHESWVSARQAERRLEDAKQEAAQLRNRLTLKERSYVEDKTQNRMQSPLEQNGDVAISPLHMPVETPSSPPLLYGTRDHLTTSPPLPNLPPFLPPPPGVPFIPPPIPGVPGFMPPPPSMFPVDHRPPPLGRMSSPPPPMNSRYSPDSRYSPYDRNSPSPPYDDEYGSSPPPMPMRGYSPYSRDERRDFKRPPPHLRTNGRNKGAMSSGSGNSNESLEKINRHHSKV